MDFRTKVPIEGGAPKIDHASGVFLVGSCFVENIGAKLDYFKIKNLQNPTGIIFHPSPMRNFFQRLSNNEDFQEKDVFNFNEGWQSFEAHSDMRRETKEECLSGLNEALAKSRSFIKNASHVIISLGTAWGYVFEGSENIAANCHKVPQKQFEKELSSVNEIGNDLEVIGHSIREINKNAKVIFTISPVRHIKDGFVENQQSKAHLISGLNQFLQDERNATYFPSYEIMMDELREYRFYKEDMLHPNKVAVNYIWNKFSDSWLSVDSVKLNLEIDKIQKAISHRPRAENSQSHKKFLTGIQLKIEEIRKKHPEITFN